MVQNKKALKLSSHKGRVDSLVVYLTQHQVSTSTVTAWCYISVPPSDASASLTNAGVSPWNVSLGTKLPS